MNHLIIGGWGVPKTIMSDVFQGKLQGETQFMYPSSRLLKLDLSSYDSVHAYSLGSLVLLKRLERENMDKRPCIHLYAPILAFCKEEDCGGHVKKSQLRWMIRQFKSQPIQTLQDFFEFSKLPYQSKELPYEHEEMLWGLEYLLNEKVVKPDQIEPHVDFVTVGEKDTLLDSSVLSKYLPKLKVIPNGEHSIESIVQITRLTDF